MKKSDFKRGMHSKHVSADKFIKKNLPKKSLWPDLSSVNGLGYKKRLNCAEELLDSAVSEGYGEKIAFYTASGEVTYRQLLHQANQIAHVLSEDLGLHPGQRVLIRSSNNAMMAACWFAAVKVGAVVVLSMPVHRAKELSDMVKTAQIRLAICDQRCVEELQLIRRRGAKLEKVMTFSGANQLRQLMVSKPCEFTNVKTARDQVCQISFSMAASGIARASLHFHQDFLALSDSYAKSVLHMNEKDVVIGTPSLALAYGLGALLIFPLRCRASSVLIEQPSIAELLKAVRTYRATVMFNVPTAYRMMLAQLEDSDLSSLRMCVSAGEHLCKETWHAWHRQTGIELLDGIGTTELTHIFLSSRPGDIRPGSTGKPVPGYEARVIDDNGAELPADVVGRLAVRGPTGCLYLKGECQTQYVVDGWNLTGDTFSVDKDGYFWFHGRCDDLIVAAGYNVAGPEIEAELLIHEAVADCCIVGEPDPERGTLVKAFIVLEEKVRNDQTLDREALTKTLQIWLRSQLAAYKCPRSIEFVSSLPRLTTGELNRAALCRELHRLSEANPAEETAAVAVVRQAAQTPVKEDTGYYAPAWREKALSHCGGGNIESLLLLGGLHEVNTLAAQLGGLERFSDTRLIAVSFGDCYRQTGLDDYQLRADCEADFTALALDLKQAGGVPESVVLLHGESKLECSCNIEGICAVEGISTVEGIGIVEGISADPLKTSLFPAADSVFLLLKAYLKQARKAGFVSLVQGSEGEFKPLVQGLSGLYRTVRLENPHFSGRVLLCDYRQREGTSFAPILAQELLATDSNTDVAYRGSERFARTFFAFEDIAKLENSSAADFREAGVYLITGGMGALGLTVARYLIQTYRAHVYLTGRSPADAEKLMALQLLANQGGGAEFIQSDVSDLTATRHLIVAINNRGHKLNGIIHSAGAIEDSFILKKSVDGFRRVLAAKVSGTIHLDIASGDQPLDFFVLFSSVTGILGNLGQCDYGYANAFEDYFSHYRNALQAVGKRQGKTLSVNWPYWRQGGMALSQQQQAWLRQHFGILPLETDRGLRALEFGLKQNAVVQLAVLEGDQSRIRQVLEVEPMNSVAPQSAQDCQSGLASEAEVRQKILGFLIETFSRELHIPAASFNHSDSLQNYGFDSVVMLEMIKVLEQRFPDLPKTLFYEYQTLGELAGYLGEKYRYTFAPAAQSKAASQGVQAQAAVNPDIVTARTPQPWNQEVAIVGISGRYPEAENLAEFWDNLTRGKDCIQDLPAERGWDRERLYATAPALGPARNRWGGFLKQVEWFDPLFFGIAPKDAEEIDPHERLFLETVFLAIADAGYRPDNLGAARAPGDNAEDKPVGVYAGVMWGDYHLHAPALSNPEKTGLPHSFYWAVANRVSYHFNFSGPSLTLDTACSSSITAIHLACEAIRNGQIAVAVAGAVNLALHPAKYLLLSHMRFLSSDGRCRSFGADGDGYVPAEGVGAVILKRKADALRDGDYIYALIKGTALNHGGKTTGFTVPNPNRQATLIKAAMAAAAVAPNDISYVEAHGTGTSLGDPIEIAGLVKAFEGHRGRDCAIGSVKSNIGHAEAAAGVAGLTKILLQMKHGQLAPSLHSAQLNPYAKLEQSPFYLPQSLCDWHPAAPGQARLAALSSFGAGGANGHIIVEAFNPQAQRRDARTAFTGKVAILLSARKASSLRALATEMRAFLETEAGVCLVDLAYTLQTGRLALDYGVVAVVGDLAELKDKLDAYLNRIDAPGLYSGKRSPQTTAGNGPSQEMIASWLAHAKACDHSLQQLVQAWLNGGDIAWEQMYQPGEAFRVPAPGYVFDRQRYWIEVPPDRTHSQQRLGPLLDSNVSTLDEQAFEKTFYPDEFYCRDHRLGDNTLVPGVAYLEMALQAARLACDGDRLLGLSGVHWRKPLALQARAESVRIGLYAESGGLEFEIYQPGDRILYCNGNVLLQTAAPPTGPESLGVDQAAIDIQAVRSRCRFMDFEAINQRFEYMGFDLGPSLRIIKNLHFNDRESLAEIVLAPGAGAAPSQDFICHPALLDAIVRSSIGIGGFAAAQTGMPIPVSVDKILIHRPLVSPCLSYARVDSRGQNSDTQIRYDIFAVDQAGKPLVSLYGFTVQLIAHLTVSACEGSLSKPAEDSSLNPAEGSLSKPAEGSLSKPAEGSLTHSVKGFLIKLVSQATKIPLEEMDSATDLASYGIDSVMVMSMNNGIEAAVGQPIPKTLFYECRNIDELEAYLVENYAQSLTENFSAPRGSQVPASNDPDSPSTPAQAKAPAADYRQILTAAADAEEDVRSRRHRRGSRFAAAVTSPRDIAIIGLAGRYPQAESLEAFWHNLATGKDCIEEVPAQRWDCKKNYSEDRTEKGRLYSKWGGFLKDIDKFEPEFFRISPREAEKMDPQERLFLQTAWECIEDAAYTCADLQRGTVGVFVGVMWGLYQHIPVSPEQIRYGKPSSSFSSIANRVSYTLNLNGPSMALDTMCSSSLSSLHLACQSIATGDCELAIAGGVNLSSHRIKYELLCQEQFLSSDGRCRAFGDGGDGYVPGEGVGAVLLKPLPRAETEGDSIYAVIKASAVNHGGKTGGYTVPNQRAQTAVIRQALERAGWPAQSLNYIEAHGTGTALGDPIEIAALSRALNGRSSQPPADTFRGWVGSVKANIGHLESAAGIAGVTKVLLQFKHGKIAPSIHASRLNPNIDFSAAPLQVPQVIQDWQPLPVADGEGFYPRRAGVSSFGAGGANAHILLEEYRQTLTSVTVLEEIPVLFLLSADSEDRLRRYAKRVADYLDTERCGDQHLERLLLHRLAYSSQVGREARRQRLAIVATTQGHLRERLAAYASDKIDGDDFNKDELNYIVTGDRENRSDINTLLDDDAKTLLLNAAIEKGQWQRLARLWVASVEIDWETIKPRLFPQYSSLGTDYLHRISFPCTPFISKSYWVKEDTLRERQPAAPGTRPRENPPLVHLHPLVDTNISTLREQRYSKTFSGEEFYLADHIVDTGEARAVLPGVAYLEMAKVCGDQSLGGLLSVCKIRNLLWVRPIEVRQAAEKILIRLEQVDTHVEFDVVSGADTDLVYCQGELLFAPEGCFEDEWLDIAAIAKAAVSVDEKNAIYQGFKAMGFAYGPSYRATQKRYRLAGAALCKLQLPDHLLEDHTQFYMHPALMDAAIRAGLAVGDNNSLPANNPIVPFGLEEIELRHALTKRCYAYATYSGQQESDSTQSVPHVKKYQIVITDEAGKVLVKLKNFMARPFIAPEPQSAGADATDAVGLYKYRWTPAPLPSDVCLPDTLKNVLIINGVGGIDQALRDRFAPAVSAISATFATAYCRKNQTHFELDLNSPQSYLDLINELRQSQHLPDLIVFNALKEKVAVDLIPERVHINQSRSLNALMQLFKAHECVVPGRKYKCLYTFADSAQLGNVFDRSVSGFAKSLLGVNHRFELQTLEYPAPMSASDLADRLLQEMAVTKNTSGQQLRYLSDARQERRLWPLEPQQPAAVPVNPGGVYLITGGLGKLGLLFADYLVQKYQACPVLVGRSALTPRAEDELARLRALGAGAQYCQVDISDFGQVQKLIEKILNDHGRLNGVIHSAGIADAISLLDQDTESFNRTLAPKITGTLALDAATRDLSLDFFVLFSSISALVGDLGSGSYACANRFMDAFADYRNDLVEKKQRRGHSVSINWPLWLQGGMDIPEEEKAFFNFSGIQALTQTQGLEAFEQVLRTVENHVLVAAGEREKMIRYLKIHPGENQTSEAEDRGCDAIGKERAANSDNGFAVPARAASGSAEAVETESTPESKSEIKALTLGYVREKLSETINMPPGDIEVTTRFEAFGMDSVMVMEMHSALKKDFDGLPKTLLFEYDTLASLADYLIEHYAEKLADKFTIKHQSSAQFEIQTEPHIEPLNKPQAWFDKSSVVSSKGLDPLGTDRLVSLVDATINNLPRSTKRKPQFLPKHEHWAESRPDEAEVAVIGIGARFPQAPSLADFWQLLVNGRETVETIPTQRWNTAQYDAGAASVHGDKISSKWGSFIADVDLFDHTFFRMTLAEATRLDPQVKVILTTAWQALEDAGYTPETINTSPVGVYVGTMSDDFTHVMADVQRDSGEYLGPGFVASDIANRISYSLNLQGPSLTVQTSCSSSLTALHLARTAIVSGECDYAFAGGVNLSLHPDKYRMLQQLNLLSATGRERTFDEAADGLVPSEGAGIVVLKNLRRAQADGDAVYGVIKASNLSHSGTGAGQYLPNIKVMETTVRKTIDDCGLTADAFQYIECHGTGTELGDPIELKALENAFKSYTDRRQFCALGTKANFGHMEAASGICSLIKVLLCIKHQTLVPCCNLSKVNASFDCENASFQFPSESRAWPRTAQQKLTAGINSFGIGGSNAFMVVQSSDSDAEPAGSDQRGNVDNDYGAEKNSAEKNYAILFSAESAPQLQDYVKTFIAYFTQDKYKSFAPHSLLDIAYTTQVGRRAYDYRLAIVARTRKDLLEKATRYLDRGPDASPCVYTGHTSDAGAKLIRQLLADKEGEMFTETLFTAGSIDKLVSLWVSGAQIAWSRFYSGRKPRRVSLPGYPFQRTDTRIKHCAAGRGSLKQCKPSVEPSQRQPSASEDLAEDFQYRPGVWFEKGPLADNIEDLVAACDSALADKLFKAGGDWKTHYWVDILNSITGNCPPNDGDNSKPAKSEEGRSEEERKEYRIADMSLGDALVADLQRFTQQHSIEVHTLLLGAWALLLTRLNKTTYACFGCLDTSIAADVQPCYIKMAGRQSLLAWLQKLQLERLLRYAAADTLSAVRQDRSLTEYDRENDWDSLVCLLKDEDSVSGPTIAATDQQSTPLYMQASIGGASLNLKLYYQSDCLFEKAPDAILEYLVNFLEGMLANPGRNPATLPMLTKKEYREKFWERLERQKEGVQ